MENVYGFTPIDGVAFVLFFVVWVGHFILVYVSPLRVNTISYTMSVQRERWMRNMVYRDGESPIDGILQNGLQQGVLFFASTSVLLIGGLAAGLGAADSGVSILKDLPFVTTDTTFQWQLKIFFVMYIFVFAFFKFAWSFRLHNYVLIMIGASPKEGVSSAEELEPERMENYARKVGKLHTLAAKHFTTGLNSYFFGLAASTWFLNAWLFMAATIWVFLVLCRRAFWSEFLKIVKSTVK